MQNIIALICFLTLSAPLAAAQETTRWTAPSGAWSIDHESQGWTYADPLPPEIAHVARIMIPLELPPDHEVRMCSISETPLGITDLDLGRVRSTASRIDLAAASEMFAPRQEHATSISNQVINGVSVADIATLSGDGDMTHLHRVFYLPVSDDVTFVEIDCFWLVSLDPAKVAEIPAVLSTFEIHSIGDAE
jgi:hypothetical protein